MPSWQGWQILPKVEKPPGKKTILLPWQKQVFCHKFGQKPNTTMTFKKKILMLHSFKSFLYLNKKMTHPSCLYNIIV